MFSLVPLPDGFQTRMGSTFANIELCITHLRTFLDRNNALRHFFALSLLAREALNNAMTHGNQCRADKEIRFCLHRTGNNFRLTIQDQGRGFDWHKHLRSHGDPTRENGRGHEIYATYAQDIRYSDHGATITIDYAGEPCSPCPSPPRPGKP